MFNPNIREKMVDGRHATVADLENGMVKVMFDDGQVEILIPSEEEEEE